MMHGSIHKYCKLGTTMEHQVNADDERNLEEIIRESYLEHACAALAYL